MQSKMNIKKFPFFSIKNLRVLIFVLNLHSLNRKIIGLWCNGNTTVFGAVFLGSSPSRPTSLKSVKCLNHFADFFYFVVLTTKKPNQFNDSVVIKIELCAFTFCSCR